MDEWTQIGERYREMVNNERYGAFAREMLDLVEQIQVDSRFADVLPSMALNTLTLKVPQSMRRVHVFWENSGEYSIYLDHCEDQFYGENTRAKKEEAVTTILTYLQRLRSGEW